MPMMNSLLIHTDLAAGWCAKFVLKICIMDRILQNQWNV